MEILAIRLSYRLSFLSLQPSPWLFDITLTKRKKVEFPVPVCASVAAYTWCRLSGRRLHLAEGPSQNLSFSIDSSPAMFPGSFDVPRNPSSLATPFHPVDRVAIETTLFFAPRSWFYLLGCAPHTIHY